MIKGTLKYGFCLILFFTAYFALAQEGESTGNDFRLRSVPDSMVNELKKHKDFVYANDSSYWHEERSQESSLSRFITYLLNSPVLRWTWYGLLALLIIFIIYQVGVVNNFFILFAPRRKKQNSETGEDEMSEEDIEVKLQEAIRQEEYRLAVRYLYLKTLNSLSEKNQIKIIARATNYEYLQQLRQSPRYQAFALLTRVYEYVWYGKFHPNALQFKTIHQRFEEFIAKD